MGRRLTDLTKELDLGNSELLQFFSIMTLSLHSDSKNKRYFTGTGTKGTVPVTFCLSRIGTEGIAVPKPDLDPDPTKNVKKVLKNERQTFWEISCF